MGNDGNDWIVYVAWKTIADWKKRKRLAAEGWSPLRATPRPLKREVDEYPFQYASQQSRFLKMRQGDRLWLITLPQFDGFCQAPSIMARLELEGAYDRRTNDIPVKASDASAEFGNYLAVGKSGKAIETYPPLYNIFDFLMNAEFKGSVKDLRKYKAWLAQGTFGAKGPYYRLAQHFRTLRQLTAASGKRLRDRHRIAVEGRRAFISYKTDDFRFRGGVATDTEVGWLKVFAQSLETAGVMSWWDQQQLLGQRYAWKQQTRLIGALLDDGVQQATWFVALGTEGYGSPGYAGKEWTLEEWQAAGTEAASTRRRAKLWRLLIVFGESEVLARLSGKADVVKRVPENATAEDVAAVVSEVIKGH